MSAYSVPNIYEYKRGDRRPTLSHQLRDDDNEPIDLSDAQEVRFVMEHPEESAPRVNAPIDIVDAGEGRVEYTWQDGDLGRTGEMYAEFVIYWPGAAKETIPDQDVYYVSVEEPLGYDEDPLVYDGDPSISVGILTADEVHTDRLTTRSTGVVALDSDLDAGGTVTIQDLPAPTDPTHPARKNETDALESSKADQDGGGTATLDNYASIETDESNTVQYVKTPATNTDVEDAIAALPSSGGIVEIEEGEVVGTVRMTKDNVTLRGQGDSTTIRIEDNAVGSFSTRACVRVLAEHCAVEDLRLDGNIANQSPTGGDENTADGVAIYASNTTVRNTLIVDQLGHGIIVWTTDHGQSEVDEGARNNIHIITNRVYGCRERTHIDLADTQGQQPYNPENMVVHGNIIDGEGGTGPNHGITSHPERNVVITANTIRNVVRALNLHESDTDGPERFAVIGNTIHNCDHRVELIQMRNSVVASNTIFGISDADSDSTFHIEDSENVLVAGNVMDGAGTRAAQIVGSDTITFERNTIVGPTGNGIEATGVGSEIIIRNNSVFGNGSTGTGISVETADSHIIGNYVSGFNALGLRARGDSSGASIAQNIVDGSETGVRAGGSASNVVIQSNLIKNGSWAVEPNVNGTVIRDNTFQTISGTSIRSGGATAGVVVIGNFDDGTGAIHGTDFSSRAVVKGNHPVIQGDVTALQGEPGNIGYHDGSGTGAEGYAVYNGTAWENIDTTPF